MITTKRSRIDTFWDKKFLGAHPFCWIATIGILAIIMAGVYAV